MLTHIKFLIKDYLVANLVPVVRFRNWYNDTSISFGDIVHSRCYLVIEWRRPVRYNGTTWGGPGVWRGKTYGGTTHGVMITVGPLFIMAHTRT